MNNLKAREINLNEEDCLRVFGKDKEELYSFFNSEIYDIDEFGIQSFAMSVLSDAQEVMQNDNVQANQLINVAKWLMSHLNRPVR